VFKDYPWLRPIDDAFRGIQPSGLKVICPECNSRGLLITKWIKGPPIKPAFVMHKKGTLITGVCELTGQALLTAKSQVSLRDSDINKLLTNRRCFLLFSGGKDSLATAYHLKTLLHENIKDLTAIYVDTTVGLPDNIRYVRKISKYLGIKLEIVRPKTDYFTLAKEWGIPSHGYRWCCRELKIKPIQEYLRTITEKYVIFDGIRAMESSLRSSYIPIWYHPGFRCLSASPIFNWTDEKVYAEIYSNGIPKGLISQMNSSAECWCGAYKSESDFRRLYDLDPAFFKKLANLESSSQRGYTYLYSKGKKKSLFELETEIRKQKT